MKNICFVGAKFGLGGFNVDTNLGPSAILHQSFLKSYKKLFIQENEAMHFMNDLCKIIYDIKQQSEFPFVIGGDHSIAIGTWRYMGLDSLIWIDGHEDAHTSYTSESKRLHGMPLAVLLGNGKYYFTLGKRILDPHKVTIIGARSFETQEDDYLKQIGVKIIYLEDFKNKSIKEIANAAIERTAGSDYGISLDIDVLDPKISPGTQCQECGGLSRNELLDLLMQLKSAKLKAVELVEYNPKLDVDNRTCNIINDIIKTLII